MKIKIILIVVIAIIMLLSLNGCNNENSTEKEHHEFDSSDFSDNEKIEDEVFEIYEAEFLSLVIRDTGDKNFKEALVLEIHNSKIANRGDDKFDIYSRNEVSNIEKFYFPVSEIDGFYLHSIEILNDFLIFYYAPQNPNNEDLDRNGEYQFSYNSGIEIIMSRLDKPSLSVTDEDLQGKTLLYNESLRDIQGRIENTWFRIKVPHHVNNYEFLYDTAMKLTETAELIDVQAEIDAIERNESYR